MVCINHFVNDTDAEVNLLKSKVESVGGKAVISKHWADGGAGAEELAKTVVDIVDNNPGQHSYVYEDSASLWEKMEAIATKIYGAGQVTANPKVRAQIEELNKDYSRFPVCMAKTQMSFTADPTVRGAPTGHTVEISEVRLANGSGFIVAIAGNMMTMPGLPKVPAAEKIDVDKNGNIIARPYSKFFNLGERSETFPETIDWDQKFIILDKLDGSMVHPILVDNAVVLCTKMGITDVVAPAQDFAEKKGHKAIFYMDFCYDLMKSGMTPIFEWCSRKQRIVVDYPNDMLVLTAIRKMVTGEYKLYDQMEALATPYRVPLVKYWSGTFDGISYFVEQAQILEGE